jgi:hypothetical protein
MSQLTRLASAALLAAGAFAASSASAATICNNCLYTASGATYLGSHDATTNDGSGFRRIDLTGPVASVVDTWIFDVQPVNANAQINANFIPIIPNSLPGFTINLYAVNSYTCTNGIGNSTGTSGFCSAYSLGSLIASSSPVTGGANVFPTTLTAGSYAFEVAYSIATLAAGETAEYSGQLRLRRVPEPASLALVSVALLGAAAAVRRSRKSA